MSHVIETNHIIRDNLNILSWIYFKQSQSLFWRLKTMNINPGEELIFIEFRPHWLHNQKKVYKNMQLETCSICLFDVFPERIQVQHISAHPCICVSCYKKLDRCPFCRVSFKVIYTSRRLWPMLSYI